MSVKGIRLYIIVKRNIHNNLGHKEHNTSFPHALSLFVNLPQIVTPLPSKHHNSTLSHTHTATCKKRKSIIFEAIYLPTIAVFDLLR